jgi:hypothetical protein
VHTNTGLSELMLRMDVTNCNGRAPLDFICAHLHCSPQVLVAVGREIGKCTIGQDSLYGGDLQDHNRKGDESMFDDANT